LPSAKTLWHLPRQAASPGTTRAVYARILAAANKSQHSSLLHKLAHHEVRRLGRSFSGEIEACAGAAAEVMLARADEARRLFPGLLSGSPGKAPAAPEGPALEVAGKSGLPQARSRLGESTSTVSSARNFII